MNTYQPANVSGQPFIGCRLVFLLSLLTCLSACGSLPRDTSVADKESKNAPKTESNEISKEAATSLDAQKTDSLVPSAVPDPLAGVQPPKELLTVYRQVAALNKQKQYLQSIKILQAKIKEQPASAGLYYLLGKTQLLAGDLDSAKASTEKSIELLPTNYYALNLLGVIERGRGQFEKAKEAYSKAIDVFPQYPGSYKNLAILADIYLRDLKLALTNYLKYQSLVGDADKKLSGWIKDLQRRIKQQEG